MTRRRQTFPAYVRRRWRALGLVAVLMLGALLVAAVADRGHDPLWVARNADPVAVAFAPDASEAYSLHGNGERIHALEARRGGNGQLLWSSPMNDSRALLRAGNDWVAVATDFPRAFLTVYQEDGSVRFQVPIEGNARAMASEGDTLALAVQAPGNPVLVYDGGASPRIHRFPAVVQGVDLEGGRLAVATGAGHVFVLAKDGGMLLNETLPVTIRSVSLSDDGSRLLAGGSSRGAGNLSGLVAFYDIGAPAPLRWTHLTRAGVGYVSLDAAGVLGLALEETPPRDLFHAFDTGTGERRWTRNAEGEIAQDDAGAHGGIALSPDGRSVLFGTIRGGLTALDMADGRERWSYQVDGATVVAFADLGASRHALANARVAPTGPYETLLHFDMGQEPTLARLGVTAALIVGVAAVSAALVLGVGYARLRRA